MHNRVGSVSLPRITPQAFISVTAIVANRTLHRVLHTPEGKYQPVPALIITFLSLSFLYKIELIKNPLTSVLFCMITQVYLESGSKESLLIHSA